MGEPLGPASTHNGVMSRSFESGLHVTWTVGTKDVSFAWPEVTPARLMPSAKVIGPVEVHPCPITDDDASSCQNSCDANSACQAWQLHFSKGKVGDPALRWCLKTSWTDITPSVNQTSGIKDAVAAA